MKGDFTRDTFDPVQNFSRVLMQQGRVQLDADWNEQTAIMLHYLRTLAADIIGAHAGPAGHMGFDIITNSTVTGWTQDQWSRFEPDTDRQNELKQQLRVNDAIIGAGRYYVHGLLAESHRPILYTEQPGYPFSPEMALDNIQQKEMLVYLDVWERHITYVQNDRIREVALGGADTCTRAQVVWQVKVLVRPEGGNEIDCRSVDGLKRENLPKLAARARRSMPSPELCSVSPESQYRGLENHLYRVEVHEVYDEPTADTPVATFKWSRDNGSVVVPLVSLTGNTAVVETLGRDPCAALKPGDWVEVCDEVLALREQAGVLAQVQAVDRDEMEITLKFSETVDDEPSYAEGHTTRALLRRWDHAGDLTEHDGALPVTESTNPEEDWIDLEDGVQIWFAKDGEYRVGDYWLIPARVATGDVEWPLELDSVGVPVPDHPATLPPRGPQHYYAPLYHIVPGADGSDCRCTIALGRDCPGDA